MDEPVHTANCGIEKCALWIQSFPEKASHAVPLSSKSDRFWHRHVALVVIMPLFWTVRYRGRKSAYGPSGIIGKKCVVKQWTGNRGKVWVGAELWKTTGNSSLMPGDEGLIQAIDNLTLTVVPLGEIIDTPKENLAEDRSTKL